MKAMSNRGVRAIALFVGMACVAQAANAVVNVDVWMSCDNQFELYTGTALSTTGSVIGGVNNWAAATNYVFGTNPGDYLYVVGADYGAVFGLGGYVSIDGGTTYTAILAGNGWESVRIGPATAWPAQPLIDTWISNATLGGLWTPSVAGTGVVGFGLPATYGPMPALGCIWDAQADVNDMVLFRYRVVPSPITAVPFGVVLVSGLMTRRRR